MRQRLMVLWSAVFLLLSGTATPRRKSQNRLLPAVSILSVRAW